MIAETNRTPDHPVANRVLAEAVITAAKQLGITCKTFSSKWLIRLEKDQQTHFVFGYWFDINSQAAFIIAKDKVATSELLLEAKVPVVPHYLLSTGLDRQIDYMKVGELLKQYQELVIKPTRGNQGKLVARFKNTTSIKKFIEQTDEVNWAASPFLSIAREVRLVMLNGQLCLAYAKHNPTLINGLKMYNLNLGASTLPLDITSIPLETQTLAKQAMDAVGLKLGAVDIVFDHSEVGRVLEINSGFTLEHFAHYSSENKKQVMAFYKRVVASLFAINLSSIDHRA